MKLLKGATEINVYLLIVLRLSVESNDDRLPFSLDVLSSIGGKAAIPGIFPRNQKPDMLLGKAERTHEAKALSPLSPAYKVDSFLRDLQGCGCYDFVTYTRCGALFGETVFFNKAKRFSGLLVTPDLSKLR